MSKKTIKEIFNNNINKKKIYDATITKYERKKMNKSLKYVLVPICLILVLSIMFVQNKKEVLKSGTENNDSVYINEVDNQSVIMLDIDIHPVVLSSSVVDNHFTTINELTDYPFYQNITIGSEYNEHTISAVYIKSDTTTDVYDNLYYYTIVYMIKSGDTITKEVTISFSKNNIPLKDCKLANNNGIHSTINGTDLIIHHYASKNISTFQYNGINFDIATNNLTEAELVNLLKEIIK